MKKTIIGLSFLILLIVITWMLVAYNHKEEVVTKKKSQEIEGFTEAFVIELNIKATDNLPLQILARPVPTLSDGVNIVQAPVVYLSMSSKVLNAIRDNKSDHTLKVSDDLTTPEDIEIVLIEYIHFAGEGRNENQTKVYFSRELVDVPEHSYPDTILLQIKDSITKLNEVIPMPQELTWQITEEGELALKGSVEKTLSAGEVFNFTPIKDEIPVNIMRHKPVKKGNVKQALKEKVIQEELGTGTFTSDISIHFYGSIPLVEFER